MTTQVQACARHTHFQTSYSVLRTRYPVPSTEYAVHASLVICLALSSLLLTNPTAQAIEPCCCSCGCAAPCRKVCRLECGEKKVEVICWGCKCEDFCVACKSEKLCKHCETVCENCGEKADTEVCSKPKNFVWFDWNPGGARIYTKTKLMKKVETVTVPSYKWVVEDMCPKCAANAAAANPGTIVYNVPTEATATPANDEESIFSLVRLPMSLEK